MSPRRTDDEDDDPFGIRRERTGPIRSLTPSEVEIMAKAQAEANAKVNSSVRGAERVRDLELLAAEWFGRDGSGGRLEAMATAIREHGEQLERHSGALTTLTEFKGRILWIGGLAVTTGGFLAAVAFKLLDHFWH